MSFFKSDLNTGHEKLAKWTNETRVISGLQKWIICRFLLKKVERIVNCQLKIIQNRNSLFFCRWGGMLSIFKQGNHDWL
jgi:hypothetical protein